jgi:hypothetical protein
MLLIKNDLTYGGWLAVPSWGYTDLALPATSTEGRPTLV